MCYFFEAEAITEEKKCKGFYSSSLTSMYGTSVQPSSALHGLKIILALMNKILILVKDPLMRSVFLRCWPRPLHGKGHSKEAVVLLN